MCMCDSTSFTSTLARLHTLTHMETHMWHMWHMWHCLRKHARLHARTRNAIIHLHFNSSSQPPSCRLAAPNRLHCSCHVAHLLATAHPCCCVCLWADFCMHAYPYFAERIIFTPFLPLILRAVVDILSFTFHKIFGSKIGSPLIKVIILMYVVLWPCYCCSCLLLLFCLLPVYTFIA